MGLVNFGCMPGSSIIKHMPIHDVPLIFSRLPRLTLQCVEAPGIISCPHPIALQGTAQGVLVHEVPVTYNILPTPWIANIPKTQPTSMSYHM